MELPDHEAGTIVGSLANANKRLRLIQQHCSISDVTEIRILGKDLEEVNEILSFLKAILDQAIKRS